MFVKTSNGVMGLAKQTAKGTKNSTPIVYVNYLEANTPVSMDVNNLIENEGDEQITTSIKNTHRQKFTTKFLARPQISAYILAWLLGKDVPSGSGDPYTHTITRLADGRPWLTLRQKIDTNIIQELIDTKIEKIVIEMEAGKEVSITVEGTALTGNVDTTEDTPAYESTKPFTMYHGEGAFKVATVANTNIKKLTFTISVISQELQSDGLLLEDLADLKFEVEVAADFYAIDTDFWKKANFNNQITPQEDLYTSEIECTLKYEDVVPDDRQLKLTAKDLIWNTVELAKNSEPSVSELTIAGICRAPASGDMLVAVILNSLSGALV